jgi:hypothetical protein
LAKLASLEPFFFAWVCRNKDWNLEKNVFLLTTCNTTAQSQ